MRDIKFRAWDKVSRIWLDTEEYVVHPDNGDVGEVYSIDKTLEIVDVNHDAILEQYTGLKDVNGVDVYENDIISAYVHGFQEIGIVEYSEFCEWVFGNIRINEVISSIEVIGNIHDNQELLEEK